jgi:hypothetical protein
VELERYGYEYGRVERAEVVHTLATAEAYAARMEDVII